MMFDNQLNDDIPDMMIYINTKKYSDDDINNMLEKLDDNNKSIKFNDGCFINNTISDLLLSTDFLTEIVINKCKLDNINYLPLNLQKITAINCELNNITCIYYPKSIIYIDFSDNNIELITDFPNELKYLYLNSNKLKYINDLPQTLEILSLKNNYINDTKFISNLNNLIELNLNCNNISELNFINNTIEKLDISKNKLSSINYFPKNVKEFIAYSNIISSICNYPELLYKLDLYNNNLETIPDLINNIKWIDLSSNDLRLLPKNIDKLDFIDICSNDNLIYDPNNIEWELFMNSNNKDKYIMDNINYSNTKDNDSDNLDVIFQNISSSSDSEIYYDESDYIINNHLDSDYIINNDDINKLNDDNINKLETIKLVNSYNHDNNNNHDKIDDEYFWNDKSKEIDNIYNSIKLPNICKTRYVKLTKTYTV